MSSSADETIGVIFSTTATGRGDGIRDGAAEDTTSGSGEGDGIRDGSAEVIATGCGVVDVIDL